MSWSLVLAIATPGILLALLFGLAALENVGSGQEPARPGKRATATAAPSEPEAA